MLCGPLPAAVQQWHCGATPLEATGRATGRLATPLPQVISPTKKNAAGVAQLNPRLQVILNPPGRTEAPASSFKNAATWRQGDRVVQTVNDYERDISNGGRRQLGRPARPGRWAWSASRVHVSRLGGCSCQPREAPASTPQTAHSGLLERCGMRQPRRNRPHLSPPARAQATSASSRRSSPTSAAPAWPRRSSRLSRGRGQRSPTRSSSTAGRT